MVVFPVPVTLIPLSFLKFWTLVKLDNIPILTVEPGQITVHIIPLTNKTEVREFIQALEKAAEDAGLPEKKETS